MFKLKRKKKRKIYRLFKLNLCFIFIFFLTLFGLYAYARIQPKLEIKSANSYLMYDNQNNLFFQGSGSKEWINLKDINNNIINATISTEDKNFYKHQGFDYLRILKAIYTNIRSGSKKQGASTITQQYAKNLFLDFNKTWERKLNEMWLTLQLETHYNKNDILEGYLNTINYGHGNFGIENASKFYFNKKAKNLSLAEASLLAGIPKSPSNYSPIINYKIAKKRQINILYNMFKNNYINENEYNIAKNTKLNIIGKKSKENLDSINYYQDAVMRDLKKITSIPKSLIDTGGLKIYTNLDINSQKILEQSVKNNLTKNDNIETAAIMMEPKSGKVLAIVGGKDYHKSEYNRAYLSSRQLGSTMKPLLYYSALESGFTSSTTFRSEETTFTFASDKTYSPQNYGENYGNKPISLATAISYSDNIYAVKTHMFLGEDNLINISRRLGISSKLDKVPSLALGTSSINMLEVAAAYSAFANEGYKVKANFISKVEDLKGNILYKNNYHNESILNKSLTFILNNLLTSTYDKEFIDYSYPTAIGIAPKIKHKLALKSGTTDTDHWSIGYNKDILTAVWVGYDKNKSLELSDYKYSRNIWVDATESYLKNKKDTWYKMPNNVVGVLVNPLNGKPIKEKDKHKKILYYIKGTEPKETDVVFDEILDKN